MDWFLYDNGLRHERVNVKKQKKIYITAGSLKKMFMEVRKD